MILKKKPQPKKKRSGPKPLAGLPEPTSPALIPQDSTPESVPEDTTGIEEEISVDENTVDSWEDLPGGDYLDPDENGTVWFQANNGDNWYQNADGTWTKWQD